MDETSDSVLYTAATNSLASEASDINTFELMVTSAQSYLDTDTFKAEILKIEKLIKSEFSLSKMPGPWRSAKSVCYGALSFNISFNDENGNQKGKTRLQQDIKAAKTLTVEDEISAWDKCHALCVRMIPHFNKLTNGEKQLVRNLINGYV